MSAYIEATAKKTIEKYKTQDPFEILDLIKAEVEYTDLGTLRGLYHYVRKNVFVYIDSNLDYFNKRAVAAHELAHYVLHKKENRIFLNNSFYSPSRFEREADEFAAWLLWHGNSIEDFENCTLREVSMLTGIPSDYLNLIL